VSKIIFSVIAGLALTPMGYAQASRSDSQTLQEILSELRAICSELHNQQARSLTLQVLLFQMQTYQTAINRATQQTADARSNLTSVRDGEMSYSDDIGRDEDLLHEAQDGAERKELEFDLDRSKVSLASFKTMEQDRIAVLQQAEAQLQKAEEGFDAVQSQVERLLTGLH
jgi:Tfp pilus assembly protein PilO